VGIRSGLPPVVRVCGEIDAQSAPQLRDDPARLELDLRDVTFLDCAGVNVLLATRRRARLKDGWVRVIQASSRARQTILLLGLAEVLGLGHAR
jgi:anti-sigma B factor antagonist